VAALAFVALFVSLGLAVVLVAMRGGSRGGRSAPAGAGAGGARRGRRGLGLAIGGVFIVFGALIPVAVGVSNSTTQAESALGGVQLSAELQEGRALFADNCATCHSLDDSASVGRVGPDMDVLRPQAELTLDAILQGRARGMGNMPALLVEGEEAEQVAQYVEAVAGR
jgi:mono/diheme cytochrome c family protein